VVKRLPRVQTKMAVLAVISKRSKAPGRTIAAASLREIKNDLKKNYLKDVTEKQILNVIRDLGNLIVRETHPRDRRLTLYRINPNMVEEAILSLIKLDDEKAYVHDGYEGIVYDPPSSPKEVKFLAIDDVRYPTSVRAREKFKIAVKVNYCFMNPARIFLGVLDEDNSCWLASITEILKGEGFKTYMLSVTTSKSGNWRIKVDMHYLDGMLWCEADSMNAVIPIEDKCARMFMLAGSKTINRASEWTKEHYGLQIEADEEDEAEAIQAYMNAAINGWLLGSPTTSSF